MATLGLGTKEREAVEAFRRDVVDPSKDAIILLDFWAEWCGPCKSLAPILDKVVADYAPRVKLAKINVDENRLIAEQFRIQSIPTVYAIFQGQPVADLTQARTERELKFYLDQLLRQLPVPESAESTAVDIAGLIDMGEAALAEGDATRALSIFSQLADMAPDDLAVTGGLARALIVSGQTSEAETLLSAIAPDKAQDPSIARARAAIILQKEAVPVDDLAALKADVLANPDDHDRRYRLAGGLVAVGDRDGAADALLHIIAADRDWNEGAARTRLLNMLDAVGFTDPWAATQRRRLSSILFA